MTTDELIKALRLCSNHCNYHCGIGEKEYAPCPDCPANHMDAPLCLEAVMCEAADRLEEQDKIIKQYQKADCFLAVHGWEWEEGGCWYDD